MKIQPREIENFIKTPNPACSIILVYGPDEGLIRERISILGKSVVEDLNDPFNVVELTGDQIIDDPARLSDEFFALSMMGGRRLIRIRNAGDKLTKILKSLFEEKNTPESLILIEAKNLTPKSSLRKLCEKEKNAAAVPCYTDDERSLSGLISSELRNHNLKITADALALFASSIIGDRALARNEIEKLITYIGQTHKSIDIPDIQNCIGYNSSLSMEDVARYAASGQIAKMNKSMDHLFAEGTSPIAILRIAQNYFRRLHISKARIEKGESLDMAIKRLTPPIFFKTKPEFARQLSGWNFANLGTALNKLMETEAQCKRTGLPPETLCSRTFLALGQMGKRSVR